MKVDFRNALGNGVSLPVLREMSVNKIRHVLPLYIAVTFFSLFVIGCTTLGPDFQKPESPIADKWLDVETPQIVSEKEDFNEWWKVFQDPALNALIDKAYEQNPTLQIAGLRILEARARLGIATGQMFPQVQQLNAGYRTIQNSKNGANTSQADLRYQDLSVGFDAAWEIDFWGRFQRGVEAADAEFMASVAEYDDVLVTLVAEVARTYVVIKTLEERIKLASENAAIQKRSLEISQVRFEGELVTELDVQQAKSLLMSTKASIPQLDAQLQQALHGLSILLGKPPQEIEPLLAGDRRIPEASATIAVGIPADLLRRRPDIRRAEFLAAAQSARIGLARTDLYPHLTLIGTIGLRTTKNSVTKAGLNSTDFGDLFNSDSVEFFAGPSLSWDIFNYGRLKNNIRVQDARFQELVVSYQDTVLKATREVEDSIVLFLRNQTRKAYLAEGMKASKRSVEISLIQYRDGLVDYQRVLDTQRDLFQDQDIYTATSGDVTLNLISIYKAMGGGWQTTQAKEFVSEKNKKTMRERTDWSDMLEDKQEE